MVRERVCEPPLQDDVHVLQSVKVPTPQSAAHAFVLQERCSVRYGHA